MHAPARKKRTPTALSFPAIPGAVVYSRGTSFTIFSRHARRVWLMIFDRPDADRPTKEIELTPEKNRIGDLWYVHLPGSHAGSFYLYRMEGETPSGEPLDPEQWLLDPYARAVAGRPGWGDAAGLRPGNTPRNGAHFPKGVIVRDTFNWGNDRRPRIPLEDTIIYEVHLRGFTAGRDAHVKYPGTYRGFMEKIPYLKNLGITAVEFLPIHEFDEMEYFLADNPRRDLRNYWGYSTQAFFAPNGRYAHSGVRGGQVHEFKQLVRALHHAGIEVILDVVFNHTAEGGAGGPVWSFRGIDAGTYYMLDENNHYRNFSGCGNTFNCNHPVVQDFILDCLRYWVLEMHVDGFRFDLASVLTRGTDGSVLPDPPVVRRIAEDPILRDCKLIAEAWDAAGLYQVGSFPDPRWSEWNGRFRDDVRRFWKGDPGMLAAIAQRLQGSPDLYGTQGLSPLKSINFVTCHDGFTLYDLVSYETKHNQANREDNRDGENNNHSFNCGVEGPTEDEKILACRRRQARNLMMTLFVSLGVPMFPAGDEFLRTQQGNNNAYCQDNEISWVDWSLLKANPGFRRFVRDLIRLRRETNLFRRPAFPSAGNDGGAPSYSFIGPNGEPDWHNGASLGWLIMRLAETGAKSALLVVFNAGRKASLFTLPAPPAGAWRIRLATAPKETRPPSNLVFTAPPQSGTVLVSE